MDAKARRALLAWYAARRRDLPWRRTSDPYAIWVSEMMLQQTQVAVVVPYFEAWMRKFPTLEALAAASSDQVMAAWSGLGYYTRARNLHRGAQEIAAGGGTMPTDARRLLEVPGIGPYTAGAIASIAFGEKVPCVDGNVIRVAARHAGLAQAMDAKGKRAVGTLAEKWVSNLPDHTLPGDWNQALMELGATVCKPRNPACNDCPIARGCAAKGQGTQAEIPATAPRRAPRTEKMHFAAIVKSGAVLLVRNPPSGLLGGLFVLPGGSTEVPLSQHVLAQTGIMIGATTRQACTRHQFTHRTWEMDVHLTSPDRIVAAANRATKWVKVAELDGVGIPTAMRKAIEPIFAALRETKQTRPDTIRFASSKSTPRPRPMVSA